MRKKRLDRRNIHIRNLYKKLKKKNPKWTIPALIEEVSEQVFLAPSTVGRVLWNAGEDVPCADTIIDKTKKSE